MKKPLLQLLGLVTIVAALGVFTLPQKQKPPHQTASAAEAEEENEEKESGPDKQLSNWFFARAYPDPYYLNEKFMAGWQQAEAIRKNEALSRTTSFTGMWNSIGPNTSIGGRVLTIAIDPTNSSKLFAGSAGGGIWKSTNGGSSWVPVPTGFPVIGVASIIINPTNSNIIYAGTGEVYRTDSTGSTPNPGNTTFNVWKTRGTYGIGILKSTDGGTTWSQVLVRNLSQLFAVQRLRFDPANSNTVYACATDGLYRTTDAGANWTKIFNATYVSDVVINGTNIVAAVGNLGNTSKGIYRSSNGGSSWTKITAGLPSSFNGYIKLDCVSSSPNTIAASIGVSKTATVEIYRSTDFGLNWTGLSSSGHCKWQYWFSHAVAINPSNANKIMVGGIDTYIYTLPASAGSLVQVGTNIHDDVHDIQFDPSNANTVYVAGDGGIYKSTNISTSATFSNINNGLAATQFYASLGVSSTDAGLYLGGLQDNGTVIYNGTSWTKLSSPAGDGAAAAIDPQNDNNMLASRDARALFRSTNRGSSFSQTATYWGSVADSRTGFVAPIAYSRSNPSIVYAASDNLHKSTNGGGSWTFDSYSTATNYIEAQRKTAIAMAVSPTNPNKIYVSTSPFAQYDNDVDNIYVNGGPNVLKTTTGNTPFTSIKGTLPDRFVMDFAISSTNDDSVFVVLGGFGTSHVYVTGNGGSTWTSIGSGLPDVPFNAILIDPLDPRVLYAGCDLGIYVSPNRGQNWYDFNNGLWDATQVFDLQMTADNQLVAATHGKGIFRGSRYTNVLPVDILSFSGRAEGTKNALKWTVSGEVNLRNYVVERSADGIRYAPVTTIAAKNTQAQLTYTYSELVDGATSYFYRLRSVNNDGSYKYSGVVHIKRSGKDEFRVISNPFRNSVDLRVSLAQATTVRFHVYDGNGKMIVSEKANFTSGSTSFSINSLPPLANGVYYVEAIINGQRRWTQKLIKQ